MKSTAQSAGYYSREITPPTTRRQGFQNFVQIIINQLETGSHGEALLTAVDLLDCISGNANPYAGVTDEAAGFERVIAELKAQHQRDLAAAIKKALDDGIAEGRRRERGDLAKRLGLHD